MIDRIELKRLAEAATPGDWKATEEYVLNGRGCVAITQAGFPDYSDHSNEEWKAAERANAAFIAAANPVAVRELLASLEAVEAERDALKLAASQDTVRLNFLDRLNAALNRRYGTKYGWRLVLSDQIVRLVSGKHLNGFVGDIDLNDSNAHALPSCRDAIDEQIRKMPT